MDIASIILLSVAALLAVYLLVRHWRTARHSFKLLGFAVGLAAITETLLGYAFFLGGIGPGGIVQRTFIGDIVLAIHTPGLALFQALGIGDTLAACVTLFLYCAIWTGCWFLVIKRIYSRMRRKRDLTCDHAA